MKSNLVRNLSIATSLVVLLIAAFLFGKAWQGEKKNDPDTNGKQILPVVEPGQVVERKEVSNPPPPPKAVKNPDRVRQNLKPGKTYRTKTVGTLNARGEDKDWGIKKVVTINYAFEALVDREIERNDGATIVELRHFRNLRSVKFDCTLDDVFLELGGAGKALEAIFAVIPNPYTRGAAVALTAVDGQSLGAVLPFLRGAEIKPEQILGVDGKYAKAFAKVDRLTGKSVRITYVDGLGVLKLEPVTGSFTPDEKDFLFSSVLLSDSLIFPDADIKVGNSWPVSGDNFGSLVDPSLRARTSGEITVTRVDDASIQKKKCIQLKVTQGLIRFDDSDPATGKLGHFEPKGSMFFSPDDQIVIEARLKGSGKFERFSKDHILFKAELRTQPIMEILYNCEVLESEKKANEKSK